MQTILSDIIESVLCDDRIILNEEEKEQKEVEPSEDSTDSQIEENGINGVDLPDVDAEKAYVVKVKRVKTEIGAEKDKKSSLTAGEYKNCGSIFL